MPRFVILEHDHPALHWDLMLETGDALRTWRLARPLLAPGDRIPALALGDHRLAYLDYEGPVSRDRGRVRRWDSGTYDVERAKPVPGPQRLAILLDGKRFKGRVVLTMESGQEWLAEVQGGETSAND